MASWCRSTLRMKDMEALIAADHFPPLTSAGEWILPQNEDRPAPPPGYVVSFAHFHERGLRMPAHDFFRALLFSYDLELQHLNPNGVQMIATFVALCEGYLGVAPCLEVFRYFFSASLQRRAFIILLE